VTSTMTSRLSNRLCSLLAAKRSKDLVSLSKNLALTYTLSLYILYYRFFRLSPSLVINVPIIFTNKSGFTSPFTVFSGFRPTQ
jgi:hypothetical protein